MKTRSELRDEMAMLMGGRTAEELIFGDPTTGAHDDIRRATEIARAMVTEYGMSALGPRQLGRSNGEPFLGKEVGHEPDYSDQVAAAIDAEVSRLLDEAHAEAAEILALHRATLDRLADALVEHETLGDPELREILGPLAPWPGPAVPGPAEGRSTVRPTATGTSSTSRTGVADREPVTSAEADTRPPGEAGPPTFGGSR
jgi:cell division protease FtsH